MSSPDGELPPAVELVIPAVHVESAVKPTDLDVNLGLSSPFSKSTDAL